MIPELRERFNHNFTVDKYERFLRSLEDAVGARIEFRPCETPVFLPANLLDDMQQSALEIVSQLSTPEYYQASTRAIPVEYRAPGEGAHPLFIQVDFAVTRDEQGGLVPKLIELQGCASLYAYQLLLPHEYRKEFDLGGLEYLLNRLTDHAYLDLFREVVLNGHPPEEVILMEIEPESQKTLPDFLMTEKMIGVPSVCITDLIKRGRKLCYRRDGREIEIKRLYNRVIIDELVRKGVASSFDFREELDVEWAGHPNWYFRMSKFSLPFLNHRRAPRAWFLDQLDGYPDDLENFVLKPLFSFAGSGVKVDVTLEDLDSLPAANRGDYLLQEKVEYAPVIKTRDEPSKVEVRLMYIWPERAPRPLAVTTLTRLSKGGMMGVDFNKEKTWVGSSCSFFYGDKIERED